LLAKTIPLVKVVSFNEKLPSMNDIFKFEVSGLKFEVGQSHVTSNLKLQTSNFLIPRILH